MNTRRTVELRCLTTALALMLLGLCGGPARGDEPKPAGAEKDPVAAGKALLKEGDTLADRGQTTDAVIRYKEAFEKLLPGMRKIPFKSEVKRDVTKREALREVLIKEIDAEMTPEEFRADELGMKALGLIPRDFNLKDAMVRVYSEEIAAFYDPRTDTMHLIEEPVEKVKKAPGILERLFGKTQGFDKDENKTVIAHELTHALADQNYDIDALQKAIKDNDDQDLALSALIEGEATLTMIGAQMEDWDGEAVREMPAASLDRIFSFLMPLMPMAGGRSLREAPVIMSESMIFPYLRGMVFCAKLANDGGWDAISAAYRRPPLSTEQILHPEKYAAKPDDPTSIDLGQLDAGKEWKEVGRNVVGEMQMAVLLRKHAGKKAAAGWDGDQYAVFEGPGGRLGLVWFTTWDSAADAREFLENYGAFQTTKLGPKAPEFERGKSSTRREVDGACHAIESRGQDLVIVEGFPEAIAEQLVAMALGARKTQTTPEPR